jgi:hypothetical protein
MAERFAVKTGNWSDPTVWDNGQVPGSSDKAFANGFNVTLNEPVVVQSLSVNSSEVIVPDNKVTIFTSSLDAAPYVSSSGANASYPEWYATDNTRSTFWWSDKAVTGNTIWLAYTFDAPIVIKQYAVYRTEINYGIRGWIFQGSTDASTWTDLQTVSNNTTLRYASGILANTTAYRYYRLLITATGNNNSYAPRVSNFEMTDSIEPQNGSLAGGNFYITGSQDVTFTGKGLETEGSTCLTISAPSGSVVNFNTSGSGKILSDDLIPSVSNRDVRVVNITSDGTINFNSDVQGRGSAYSIVYSRLGLIYIDGAATVNVIGNVYGNYSNIDGPTINLRAANAVLNITGNVYGVPDATRNNTIWATTSAGTINITGNIIAQGGSGVYSTSGTTINHTGVVQVTAANSLPGIIMNNSTGMVNLTTPLINYESNSALSAYRFRFYASSSVEWQVQDTENNNFNIYSSNVTGSTLGLPLTTNVRSGITFGPDNDLTGTLIVPSADNVRKGVAVDNTTGTAELTAEDFLTAISSSTNPVATRLKNVATVQTVGEQFNAFNP